MGLEIYQRMRDFRRTPEPKGSVARLVVREHPTVATVERALKRRKAARIYVDHMQNARGKWVVAPYSVRPRAGAPVSAPLRWGEVERRKVRPQEFTIKNISGQLKRAGDLFKPVLGGAQHLRAALAELENVFSRKKQKAGRDVA